MNKQSRLILKKFITRCKGAPTRFINNFCKIRHPKAGIIPFNLFSYQQDCVQDFLKYRFTIFRKCRQSGVSTLCGAFSLWYAMFFPYKTILVVSRTERDAKDFLKKNVKDVYDRLPKWMHKIWIVKTNAHEVMFNNGSKITSLNSHPNVLRSHSSSLNIIDESAFMPDMDAMWEGGYPCAKFDTLIQTNDGLIKIQDIADSSGDIQQRINLEVSTDDGYRRATHYRISGNTKTKSIKTEMGFEFEGTPHHKVRKISDSNDYIWSALDDLQIGDTIVTLPGQFRGRRRYLDNNIELGPDLAEILGLYIGDGHLSIKRPKRFIISFDPQDVATRDCVVEQFNSLKITSTNAYGQNGHYTEDFRLNSADFIELMCRNGLNSKTCSTNAEIPSLILQSDRAVLCAFLRGLFDSDGWCYQTSTSLKLGVSTSSCELSKQIQIVLHSLGIISRRSAHVSGFGSKMWKVEVRGLNNIKKFSEIGFISRRKKDALLLYLNGSGRQDRDVIDHPMVIEFAQEVLDYMVKDCTFRTCQDKRKNNISRIRRTHKIRYELASDLVKEMPLTSNLAGFIRMGMYFDKVRHIKNSRAQTYDLSVPSNNTYLANGLVSHNTLMHGGNVIVVSTTNGIGNWYWQTWVDAESGYNNFHPITINWWDMDWEIKFTDEFTGKRRLISPREGLKKCATTDEIEKFGPYWSPWLDGEYKQLSKGGDARGFRQEVLADFVGSGKTVLTPQTLNRIGNECEKKCEKVRIVDYVNPFTNAREKLDFEENFWVWKRPLPDHIYSVGVDTATGTGHDFSTIEVLDIMENEQVAELRIKVPPGLLAKMADFIARTYNYAILVVERTGIGEAVCSELNTELRYPNLYRDKLRQEISGRKNLSDIPGKIGFATTGSSKAVLDKGLLDYFEQSNREEGFEAMRLYSHRLYKELQMYIYITEKKTGNEPGGNNHDDLVIAIELAILGTMQAIRFSGAGGLMPYQSTSHIQAAEDKEDGEVIVKGAVVEQTGKSHYMEVAESAAGKNLMMPFTGESDIHPKIQSGIDKQDELNKFVTQIGGIPIESRKIRPSSHKKHQIDTMRLSGSKIHGKKKEER